MHELMSTLQDLWHTVHTNGFQTLGPLSYLLIAVLVATEGPITTLIGAAGAAAGFLDIRFVFIATAIGNIVGDAVWYSLGYVSKSDRLHKLTGRFGIQQNHIEQMREEMRCHATKAILVAKITFGLIIPTLVAAGFARVPLRKWLPAVLVAETLWTILLVTLGFHAAGAIAQIENGFRIIGLVAATGAVTFILLYLKRKRRQFAAVEVQQPVVQPLSESVAAHEVAIGHRKSAYGQPAHRHTVQRRRPVPANPLPASIRVMEKA